MAKEINLDNRTKTATAEEKLAAKFVNCVMRDGKKNAARRVVKDALLMAEDKIGEPALSVLKKAVDNIRPAVEVKSRRIGGSTYQVPTDIKPNRQTALAFRWLITFSRNRSEKGFVNKLASELLDAYNNRGGAIKKREDTHKMAEANKAFAHFRW
ncbi:MAG: 30S ribosomal protein S7 [Proteobacteria bacterium]|nr:30S ribosomal protein S7 [Pseudomonadota bacterium]MBU1388144.1 30S ribosomal protein S7 [Pseudomonadota bacterium]MBU1541829.1 30S ribosomal protein S7 [Pseudomonadota bacterium]MBU2429457.1 30S ribosomal protein S7 [Pseudomonadota bacterium]MBU2481027.1 30S ribosomal protein S7 [Pseudomonadota bacterium]